MPTDVLCNILEGQQLINNHQATSDSVLISNNLLNPTSSSPSSLRETSSNDLLKNNTRSASLPLKILLNESCASRFNNRHKRLPLSNSRVSSTISDLNEKLIRSWNGMDTFLMNQLAMKNDSANNDETNFILYARFSLSEHFLNLIGADHHVIDKKLNAQEKPESPPLDYELPKENLASATENYYEDDEEVMSSSPLLSESSTIGSEDAVQFVLDTEDPKLSSHSTLIGTSSPTVSSEYGSSNDINNNNRCVDFFDDEASSIPGLCCPEPCNTDHGEFLFLENSESDNSSKKCAYQESASNDLDQTITYEQSNNTDELYVSSSNTSDSNMENLIKCMNKLSSIEAESDSYENKQSSPFAHSLADSNDLSLFSSFNTSINETSNQEINSNITNSYITNSECESSGFNSSICSSTHNDSITTPTSTPTSEANQEVEEANTVKITKEKSSASSSSPLSWSIGSNSSSSSMMSTSGITDEDEDDIFKNFMPKKSCLKKNEQNRQQLYIDTSSSSSGACGSYPTENATSSPLVPATPTSPLSSSISSSPFFSSTSSSFQSPPDSSTTSADMSRPKKRVSFADVCGKDLFTIRTMSEPSNCPPKLTSKIVQFFLNREFNQQSQQQSLKSSCYNSSRGSLNDYMYPNANEFFSRTRNYGYGISASNYTNDLNQLAGTIAVYSLNFAQPAADYFKFRQRILEKSVSLENVFLNRFQINGTVKVKNIHFHKQIFIRCSFDNWTTHEDYPAHYVPFEYYSSGESMMSTSNTMLSSPTSHSVSATFYASSAHNNHGSASGFQPHTKEFDTFRFEFELPKSPADLKTSNTNSPNASIQFCICFRTGDSIEYWDNNDGKNYEILQYVIDIESLKPQSKSSNAEYSSSKSRNYKYEGVNSRTPNNPLTAATENSGDVYY